MGSDLYSDYAFVPGSSEFDARFAELFDVRAQTVRLKPPEGTLRAFAGALRNGAEHPIREVFLAAHSWIEGEFKMPLRIGAPMFITFEDLVTERAAGNLDLGKSLTPRPKDSTGKRQSAAVHIRGCRLGRAVPFLQLLNECFGAGVARVTAPKHFNAVARFSKPDGCVEYMVYGLQLNRPERFTSREEALTLFATAGLRDIADRPFDSKLWWGKWIPQNPNKEARDGKTSLYHPVALGNRPVPWSYDIREDRLLFPVLQPTSLKAKPTSAADKKKAALEVLAKEALFSDTYAFPMYRRLGHPSLKEMVEGWRWVFIEKEGKILMQGMRQEYTLLVPVTAPGTQRLLVNFYPKKAGTAIRDIKEDDPRLFARYP
jgi:hypothetical protein